MYPLSNSLVISSDKLALCLMLTRFPLSFLRSSSFSLFFFLRRSFVFPLLINALHTTGSDGIATKKSNQLAGSTAGPYYLEIKKGKNVVQVIDGFHTDSAYVVSVYDVIEYGAVRVSSSSN